MLATLPSIDYGAAPLTLVLALSTTCNSCEASLPFYKQFLDKPPSSTRMVAIFPNPTIEVEQYKQQHQLNINSLAAFNYKELNISATPTLVLVDSTGRILDFWVGKLSHDEELQVIKALK